MYRVPTPNVPVSAPKTTEYRVPVEPPVQNTDDRTIELRERNRATVGMEQTATMDVTMNQATAIRIDDNEPDVRKSFSSQKIMELYAQTGRLARFGTTAMWEAMPTFVPEMGEFIIYTDRNVIDDVAYCGVKVGNGVDCVGDLPFIGDDIAQGIVNFINAHINNSSVHVTASEKESWDGKISDVQFNGTSLVRQGVADVPMASASDYGVVRLNQALYGLEIVNGLLQTSPANASHLKQGANGYRPVTPNNMDIAVFYGFAKLAGASMATSQNPVGEFTDDAKSKISDMLNAPVSVDTATPSIIGQSGLRYICGECATLSIIAPSSGCIDVVFTSGSTPTVLTVSSAKAGATEIKWANGFDPSGLNANTTYEINILDGEYGVVGMWT